MQCLDHTHTHTHTLDFASKRKMQLEYENYDPSFPDQPVVDLYLPMWAKLPAFKTKPAFIWVEEINNNTTSSPLFLTYQQLNSSANAISSHLLIPLQRGDTVLLLCSPGLDLVELIFGCQRAGLLSVPMIPPHPSFAKQNHHHLVRVISQTKPKAAIAHPDYIKSIQHYISSSPHNNKLAHMLQSILWISIDDLKSGTLNCDSQTYNGCRADEVYLVQYTSGATGIPKPVLVTAGSAAHNVRTARKAYDLHPNSTIVSWLPQYHDCGLVFLLLTIVSGATCVLTSPSAFIKRPRLWLELMSEFRATCTPVPSFTLPLVVKRGGINKGTTPINLSTMKNLIIINEPIYRDSVEEFVHTFSPFGLSPSSISPSYGLAENCTFVSTSWRSETSDNFSTFPDFPTYNMLLPVARLCSQNEEQGEEDVEIMVVNEETLEPVEDGVEGEIWVSSPSNASGYLGHPSLTREVFHARVRNMVRKCFLRTGDRGIVRGKQRYLFVTGRCQDLILLQDGRRIHPHYIETAAYNSCRKLLRGGCVAAFQASTNVVVIVAEMQRIGENVETGVLRSICEGIRDGVWKKERVEVVWVVLVKSECVPKTTSGKLQRWEAKEKLLAGKMIVLMEMRFGKDAMRRTQEDVRKVAVKERNGSFLSAETRTSLISHL